MKDIEEPAYVLYYRAHPTSKHPTLHLANLSTLLGSKPGEEKVMDVYVRPADVPTGNPIKAKATISSDRKTITVTVTIGDGQQKFFADSASVRNDMKKEHPNSSW